MTYDTLPAISGVTIPRPSGLHENDEPIRSSVVLAGGGLRSYSGGVRKVFELSWSKATEDLVSDLRSLLLPAFVAYRHSDGTTRMVETSGVSAEAIAGTDPVRFSVSVSLREQNPTT